MKSKKVTVLELSPGGTTFREESANLNDSHETYASTGTDERTVLELSPGGTTFSEETISKSGLTPSPVNAAVAITKPRSSTVCAQYATAPTCRLNFASLPGGPNPAEGIFQSMSPVSSDTYLPHVLGEQVDLNGDLISSVEPEKKVSPFNGKRKAVVPTEHVRDVQVKRMAKEKHCNADIIKRFKYVYHELGEAITEENIESGKNFCDSTYKLVPTLKAMTQKFETIPWKVNVLNRRGLQAFVKDIVDEDMMEDVLHVFKNLRIKEGYKSYTIVPVLHSGDNIWSISIDWPGRSVDSNMMERLNKFEGVIVNRQIAMMPGLTVNEFVAKSLEQLIFSLKAVRHDIMKKFPLCDILQFDYHKVLKKARKDIRDCDIRVDHMTDDAMISCLRGVGPVTAKRINCILRDGIDGKVWHCSYHDPKNSGDRVNIMIEYCDLIDENDCAAN